MHSDAREDPLYSPIPGIIPGEIDVTRRPVAPRAAAEDPKPIRAPRPVRPARSSPADNPQHVRPWRNRIAAAALLSVAIVSLAVSVFAL
jgi:hypothetical protein